MRVLALAVLLTVTSAEAAPPTVLVVKSRDLPAYEAPVGSLREALSGLQIRVVTMRGDAFPDPADADLIVALGSRALHHGAKLNRPLIFAMVLRPERQLPPGASHVAGVRLDVSPDVVLTQLRLVAGDVRRVAVVHAGTSGPSASVPNVSLRSIAVTAADDVPARLESLRDDALWMPADPVAVTRASFEAAVAWSRRHKRPLVAWSGRFVEAGALLSVEAGPDAIGSQLALMARRILEDGVSPATLGIQPPIGTRLVVNRQAAEAIGLTLSDEVLESADRVVGE